MADFNGRIEEIVHAFEKYPAGDINTRMIVRRVLARERSEGFEQGYSEGMHDQRQAQRSERERTEKEAATATADKCPTSCDPECELGPHGCHERHQPAWKRSHDPVRCENDQPASRRKEAAEAVKRASECPACASAVRAERGYVPGQTGQPVSCGNEWHYEEMADA